MLLKVLKLTISILIKLRDEIMRKNESDKFKNKMEVKEKMNAK